MGLYCCGEIDKDTLNRCMCVFATEKRRNSHRQKGIHNFPAPDLKTHVHLLHLSGKFAFTLATGSMTNRCDATNTAGTCIIAGKQKPRVHADVRPDWCKPGCYRKHARTNFSASNALVDDLEALFLDGFRRDGAKKGSNKYTPESALTFLRNLRTANGRRKFRSKSSPAHWSNFLQW